MLISLRAAVRRWAAAARSDRGSMAVEVVVLFPLLFGLMFLGVQGALIYQGRAVALAAAQEGARTAAAYGASIGDGLRQARAFADTSSANLRDIDVSGRRTSTQVTVEVHTSVQSVVPGWHPRLTQSATLPVERVTG